jgi:hypothetical protein
MNTLWTEFLDALVARGHAPPCGVVAATLAEADTAVTAVRVPLCVRPLDLAGEYALAVAEHPADAELAFDRARRLSPTGRALFQPHRPGPVYAVYAQPGANDRGDLLFADLHYAGKLALVPIRYGFSNLPDTPPWREMAETALEALRRTPQLPPTPAVFLFGKDPDGLPLHAFHFGTHDAVLVHVLDQIWQKTLPLPLTLRFLEPPTGRITRVDGLEAARAIPDVIEVALRAEIGHQVRHLTSIAARDAVGYVLAGSAEAAAAASALITFETSPCL